MGRSNEAIKHTNYSIRSEGMFHIEQDKNKAFTIIFHEYVGNVT